MNDATRDRLINAALELFAAHGFRGAAVRDICNLAGANPGAVSYHFGGKRQLYRAVLRQAVERLTASTVRGAGSGATPRNRLLGGALAVEAAVSAHPEAAHLILRDLVEDGSAALEALAPALRRAQNHLRELAGGGDEATAAAASRDLRLLLLELAAPLFLVTGGWPLLERALGWTLEERSGLVEDLLRRVVA